MSDQLIVSSPASAWDPGADKFLRDPHAWRRAGATTADPRPRHQRVVMIGSGYQAVVDGQQTTLINLSLTGAQILGSIRVLPDQPAIVNIGWKQDKRPCAAIARVRWVQAEPEPSIDDEVYRVGLAFETWDVRRLKEILRHCERTRVSTSKISGSWSLWSDSR